MLQNTLPLRNIRSFRAATILPNGPRGPKPAAIAASRSTVRMSSGMSANILDFLFPQKHVLNGMLAMETTGKAGVGEVYQASRDGEPGRRQISRRLDSGKQGNELKIR